MASAAKSKDGGEGEVVVKAAPGKSGRGSLLLILGAAVIAAAMASGGTWFLASRHAPAKHGAAHEAARDTTDDAKAADGDADATTAKGEAPALYLELTPAFVVNMADEESMRFLQVEVQLMARDPKVVDAAKNNMPRIRNALMLLFSQQHAHDIGTRPAKEALQKQALDEVRRALKEENAPSEVDAVYFTSFVMQ
ncbi:flagellar basal body-associated FliL family protein [Nevskia soli]|uniref:flagellar basal body-associated FliL family protein n=1 Tax=Nevskia soli TaxID=418856 RepID=UPI00068BB5E5|nr:flagellar basal body-associated FliL family protein [Nevskia soli]